MEKQLTIAIDGYSSCGKSTFAKAIAKELKYLYIDSGAMYRAVTLFCLRKGYISNEGVNKAGIISEVESIHIDFVFNTDKGEYETYLNSENVESEIRSLQVTSYVSRISQIAQVRLRMVHLQREIGIHKGIVMDGRDIGTVVFPDADIKIFMTASVDVRAKRRYDELTAKGIVTDINEVKNSIVARDIADENRDISPLRRADDAIILDNSRMSVSEQMTWVKSIIDKTRNGS
jgi:cytidylate kinase